ncbi:hypothetical protein HDU84_003474 [Entophlyctis sp. JEL0112]|nr:hypothetical protein HDU84_003474 [Entophlyctis sp. JEL0112]
MRDKSPANRNDLTLSLVLSTIDNYWRQKTTGNVLVFVGIDEYQRLGQENLKLLLDLLCDVSGVSEASLVTLFCMLAGTDLNMTSVARTSHPNTIRTPIRFLTLAESMKAISPYISRYHSAFVASEAFAQNVYYLGGVPRLLTEFAHVVVRMKFEDLVGARFVAIRKSLLANLKFVDLSISNMLTLLAISFSNTGVESPKLCPFSESSLESVKTLSWNQMVSNGMCLIQDDGRVSMPFHMITQVLDRQERAGDGLNEFDLALLSSLRELASNVEAPLHNVPAWLSWESFGAHFYCLRINSFLVLGHKVVRLSDILRGAQFSSADFDTEVHIRIAKVFKSNEQYGPDMPRFISHKNASYITVDWVDGRNLQVVLNGDDGPGVDIFFALKRKDGAGCIVVLDQRKRLSWQITKSSASTFISKIPRNPTFLNDVENIVGLMSIYSRISMDPVPNATFYVSTSESPHFHGTLFDHPGCSVTIDVNSSLKTSIQQLFRGTDQKRKELAERVIEHRKKGRIENFEHLQLVVSKFGGELDEKTFGRISF